jgi:hypothetical protein
VPGPLRAELEPGERLRCANWYSWVRPQPSILTDMVSCAYCDRPATMKIVSYPDYVCVDHALEFWSGLLVYAKDRSEPSVNHQPSCVCESCEELSASHRRAAALAAATEEMTASYLRGMAVAAAGPSPDQDEDFLVRLAS